MIAFTDWTALVPVDWHPTVHDLRAQLADRATDIARLQEQWAGERRQREVAVASEMAARTLATELAAEAVRLKAQLADAYVRGPKGRLQRWSASEQVATATEQNHA